MIYEPGHYGLVRDALFGNPAEVLKAWLDPFGCVNIGRYMTDCREHAADINQTDWTAADSHKVRR
jgi:hypothetical protein